ncbi:hypothetical protein JCM10213v2_007698 [Rhodosporidiobolus nylandii]
MQPYPIASTSHHPFSPSPFNPSSSPRPPSSDPGAPSSPTTSSFYRASPSTGARPPHRAYKSHTSSRRRESLPSSPAAQSSSLSTSARLAALSAAHAARAKARPRRSIDEAGGGPDEPGGWTARGEWEEFTREEEARLEVEMMRARREYRWEQRMKGEEAEEAFLGMLEEDEDEGEEPPPDVLNSQPPSPTFPFPNDDAFLSLPSPSLIPPRLPSLASDPGSSSAPSDSELDADMDLGESQDSQSSLSAPPRQDPGGEQPALQAFDEALLGAQCPACKAEGAVQGDGKGGARCAAAGAGEMASSRGAAGCGWGIDPGVMEPLRTGWVRHG